MKNTVKQLDRIQDNFPVNYQRNAPLYEGNLGRRSFLKTAGKAGAGALIVAGAGSQLACDSASIERWAGIVVTQLQLSQPILADLLPPTGLIVEKAIIVAQDLQKALKDKVPSAIGFLRQLIEPNGLFSQIADAVGLIADQSKRRILAGILALTGVALNLVAASLEPQAATITGKRMESVASPEQKTAARRITQVVASGKLELALAAVR